MKCTCPMQTLMAVGCKCGAINSERANHQPEPDSRKCYDICRREKLPADVEETAKDVSQEWYDVARYHKPTPTKDLPEWMTKEETMEEWIDRVQNEHWDEFQQILKDCWTEVDQDDQP